MKYLSLLIFIVLLQAGCDRSPAVIRQQFYSFGTIVDVSVWGVDQETAEKAFHQLQQDLDYMHGTWHAWHPGPVSRINELLVHGRPFGVAPSVLPLIEQSKTLYVKSHGLFNPAIGGLVAMWGFAQDEPPLGPPPDPKAIQAYLADLPTMDDIVIHGVSMVSNNPAVQLNFGAFAKGYAVDMLIDQLRNLGINNAIVNAGGDLRAIGSKGDTPWRIGIRHPSGEGVLASLEIHGDESVFTSGDYERFFEYEGKRYHHILDPRTGYPATGSHSVTVIHHDAAVADAAATALFIAGPSAWPQIAKSMGVDQVMLVADDLIVHMTPSMQARIRFETDQIPTTVVTPLP